MDGGAPIISETNVDTLTTNSTIESFRIGGQSTGAPSRYDDFYICDTTGSSPYNANLGDCRIITGKPDSDASPNDGTRSTGSNNYEVVDDADQSTADYLDLTNTAAQADWFGTDLAIVSDDQVLALQARAIVSKTDADVITAKLGIRQGATESYGSTTYMPEGYFDHRVIFLTDPVSGVRPTYTEANSMDVGIEVV